MARGVGGHSPANVEKYLKGQSYPASKDDLIETARDNRAPGEVMEVIENLRREEFSGPEEVMKGYGDERSGNRMKGGDSARHHRNGRSHSSGHNGRAGGTGSRAHAKTSSSSRQSKSSSGSLTKKTSRGQAKASSRSADRNKKTSAARKTRATAKSKSSAHAQRTEPAASRMQRKSRDESGANQKTGNHKGAGFMSGIVEKVKDFTTSQTIDRKMLMDKLSEFLAVEKGGVKLYTEALRHVMDDDVRDKFNEFLGQTRRHVEILEGVIRDLGGQTTYMSPSAGIAEEKAEALLKTMAEADGASGKQAELNAIENIVIAETKDHADWELLGKIARRTDDSDLRAVLQPAVDEVEPQEDDHLFWTKEQMSKLAIAALAA
jgi:rubrerythrin